MLSHSQTAWPPQLWHEELRSALRSSEDLLDELDLTRDQFSNHRSGPVDPSPDFPVMVPRSFAKRMAPRDPQDPLLLQVLAGRQEQTSHPGFVRDPLAETDTDLGLRRSAGLIQKYRGRALLIATQGCAVHCRYCFRRHFPYSDNRLGPDRSVLAEIRDDPSIQEVILSGGDPLLLGDRALGELVDELDAIDHVNTIRIHSRIPVVLPSRTTDALLDLLARGRTQKVVVIHVNHPNELDDETERAFRLLRRAGATLLNQAVLLRSINDTKLVLAELSRKLFAQGVLPYYLHAPDRVLGTHHFYIEDDVAKTLHLALQSELPGYLVPRLVREIPGEHHKTLL